METQMCFATPLLRALAGYLKSDYMVVSLDFQRMSQHLSMGWPEKLAGESSSRMMCRM